MNVPDQYRDKIQVDPDDHWLWLLGTDSKGYAWGSHGFIHRHVWELLIGPPPEVLHHDPACPKNCVNPSHLTPTTHATHPDSAPAWQAAKTHCPHGHPLDGIVKRSNGLTQRYCKTCHRLTERRRKEVSNDQRTERTTVHSS